MSRRRDAREAAEFVIHTLRRSGHVALLAGGCVRDLLLGQTPKDYDVATDAPPDRVVQLFRRSDRVGAKFGVVLVRVYGQQIEVATFRTDGDYADGRHPEAVRFGTDVEDANRRDFTINGMFYDVDATQVIDHVGGLADLEKGVIRAIGDPEQRVTEDHLRMVRAVRFAARLGFEIEAVTFDAIRRHAPDIRSISAERVRAELQLILTAASRAQGWELLVSTDLADHLIAGATWSADEAATVGRRLAALPQDARFETSLAALLRAAGPAEAGSACRRLTCSNAECKAVTWLLRQLPRVEQVDALDLADLKFLMADEGFADLEHLLRCELVATGRPLDAYEALLARAAGIPADEIAPPPLVTGDDLLALNVEQGPLYADILRAVYRDQLNKVIVDRQAALARVEELLQR